MNHLKSLFISSFIFYNMYTIVGQSLGLKELSSVQPSGEEERESMSSLLLK